MTVLRKNSHLFSPGCAFVYMYMYFYSLHVYFYFYTTFCACKCTIVYVINVATRYNLIRKCASLSFPRSLSKSSPNDPSVNYHATDCHPTRSFVQSSATIHVSRFTFISRVSRALIDAFALRRQCPVS